jgi:protein tyrosine phosphatase
MLKNKNKQVLLTYEGETPLSRFADVAQLRDLNEEFHYLGSVTTNLKEIKERMFIDLEVYDLNRYLDINPFKDSRVVLNSKKDGAEDLKYSYINACYIDTPLAAR